METGVTNGIPMTAWQQAVVVVLFILFVVVIAKLVERAQRFMAEQQSKLQAFYAELNKSWQSFIREERVLSREEMMGMKVSIDNLAKFSSDLVLEVREIRKDLHDHDANVVENVKRVESASKTRPRQTRAAPGD